VNEKVEKLNGKGPEASSPQRKRRTSQIKRRRR